MWVAVELCCNFSLLIVPVLGSLVCEWLWCLAAILACWSCHPWLCRMWVAVVPYCNSGLLIMPLLGSSACEWLWCLAAILTYWSYLFLALQFVSGCDALLQFYPIDHACPWLSSLWVAMVHCCNYSLLIMPILGSIGCEWLWFLAAILACWSCLSLALQPVSGCGALLQF